MFYDRIYWGFILFGAGIAGLALYDSYVPLAIAGAILLAVGALLLERGLKRLIRENSGKAQKKEDD